LFHSASIYLVLGFADNIVRLIRRFLVGIIVPDDISRVLLGGLITRSQLSETREVELTHVYFDSSVAGRSFLSDNVDDLARRPRVSGALATAPDGVIFDMIANLVLLRLLLLLLLLMLKQECRHRTYVRERGSGTYLGRGHCARGG
jgi:hypothetical protein